MSDSLDELLKTAAEKSPPRLGDPSQMAGAALATARRRRVGIRIAASVALLCVVAITVVLLRPRENSPPRQVAINIQNNDGPTIILSDLRQQIADQEKIVDELESADRLARAENRIAEYAAADQDPTERTAETMIAQANLVRDLGMADLAEADYRQVVDYFPDTLSAKIARKTLDSLNVKG